MKRCPRCGRYLENGKGVCLHCGYSDKVKKKEYCPECGSVLDEGVCHKCDYKKQGLNNVCPLCGRAISKGVCKRCGYHYKESDKKCPYCHQSLVNGYCYNCNYKKGETFKYLIVIIVAVIAFYLWIRRKI